ncbi:MAG: putative ABC transporter permease [Bacilli bacterium]
MSFELFEKWFLLFLIYSFVGWLLEVVNGLIYEKKFINRGFMIGPFCPIYGVGALLITFLLQGFISYPLILFIMASVIFSSLEYVTSYLMEKIFNARWWDYSNTKYNLNGRICFDTMLPFSILGCVVMYLTNPFFKKLLNLIPSNILNILFIVLSVLFILDLLISFKIIINFKHITKRISLDSTEEITRRVREVLGSQSYLNRRLINAFSTLKITVKKIGIDIKEGVSEAVNKKD